MSPLNDMITFITFNADIKTLKYDVSLLFSRKSLAYTRREANTNDCNY